MFNIYLTHESQHVRLSGCLHHIAFCQIRNDSVVDRSLLYTPQNHKR